MTPACGPRAVADSGANGERRRLLQGATLALAAAALGGCGFALQRTPDLPFQRIALTGFGPRSALADQLRAALAPRAQVVAAPAQAQVVLHAQREARERAVVAPTAAAQVRELQLRLNTVLLARTPQGAELMPAFASLLTRDMSYSETAALGKASEEEALYREMEADLVRQVLRRLAALRL